MTRRFALALLSASAALAENAPPASPDDPYLWLEDVNGERALEWARAPLAYVAPTGVALAVGAFFGLAYLTLWSLWPSSGPARPYLK